MSDDAKLIASTPGTRARATVYAVTRLDGLRSLRREIKRVSHHFNSDVVAALLFLEGRPQLRGVGGAVSSRLWR